MAPLDSPWDDLGHGSNARVVRGAFFKGGDLQAPSLDLAAVVQTHCGFARTSAQRSAEPLLLPARRGSGPSVKGQEPAGLRHDGDYPTPAPTRCVDQAARPQRLSSKFARYQPETPSPRKRSCPKEAQNRAFSATLCWPCERAGMSGGASRTRTAVTIDLVTPGNVAHIAAATSGRDDSAAHFSYSRIPRPNLGACLVRK